MRLIIFAVIGLVIGLGGGSGMAVMRAKKTMAAAADSVAKKDSSRAEPKKHGDEAKSEGGEGAEHVAATKPDSQTTVAQVPAKHDSVVSAPLAAPHGAPVSPAPTTAVAAKPGAADTAHAGATATPGRIAKIFAAMSSKDAARVLQQLDDSDVQTVLAGLNEKQAAAILAGFPAERAAAISRAALRGKKGAS